MTKKSKTKKTKKKVNKPPEVQAVIKQAERVEAKLTGSKLVARETQQELSRVRKLWLSQRAKITREQGKVLLEHGRLRGLQQKLAEAKMKELKDETNKSQKTA